MYLPFPRFKSPFFSYMVHCTTKKSKKSRIKINTWYIDYDI